MKLAGSARKPGNRASREPTRESLISGRQPKREGKTHPAPRLSRGTRFSTLLDPWTHKDLQNDVQFDKIEVCIKTYKAHRNAVDFDAKFIKSCMGDIEGYEAESDEELVFSDSD